MVGQAVKNENTLLDPLILHSFLDLQSQMLEENNPFKILNQIVQILATLPGVQRVEYFQSHQSIPTNLVPDAYFHFIPLRTKDFDYGKIVFTITHLREYQKYESYIDQLISLTLIVFEHHFQHDIIEREHNTLQSQRLETIGQLTSGIAHDFNNFLTAILGYAELTLLEFEDSPPDSYPEEFSNNLREIIVTAKNAKDLILQILQFSRNQDSPLQILDMDTVLKKALQLVKMLLPGNISLHVLSSNLSLPFLGSEVQIIQVLLNLCANAIQAYRQDPGDIEIEINRVNLVTRETLELLFEPDLDYLLIRIKDSGGGISQETISHLFNPFFTTKQSGTGLGLVTSRKIIEQHHGFLNLESVEGEGTTATFFLPLCSGRESDLSNKIAQTYIPVKENIKRSVKILIVDDDMKILSITQKLVEYLGYQALYTSDPKQGLDYLYDHPDIQVVMSDYFMPDMNGAELAKKIHEINPWLPIIICSGSIYLDDVEIRQNPYIFAYLQKPVDIKSLKKTLQKALTRKDQLEILYP